MSAEPPFGGGEFIADKSAWARAGELSVSASWMTAVEAGQIATCPITKLELLYSTRSAAEFAQLDEELAQLRCIHVTRSICDAAMAAMRELADRGHHKIPLPDLFVAACAAEAAIGVLHYDHHFDTLGEVLEFESRWIAEPGCLD